MKTLAITGSSGSGKTTVSELFLKLDGTFLINTDELAREMAEKDDDYLNEIILEYGKIILNEQKKLNRKRLSQIIAESDEARASLNSITKKNLMPKVEKIIKENSDKKIIVVDIPILFENKLEDFFDKILVIISDREEQIKRICIRDGLERYEAEARINIQLENDEYIKKSDYVIYNDGKTKDKIYEEVFKIYFDMLKE